MHSPRDTADLRRLVETNIPARLDRLPWGRFHTLVVVALGITWILDGLEVTLVAAVSGALKASPTLHMSNVDVGLASSAYLAGAVSGSLFFGWLTDRLGRKKLFFITLAVYLASTIGTAFAWDFWSFAAFRFLTGAGIGGEYAAINSTIQELMPARVRGWTDLVINGSFWIGAAAGAALAVVLLDPAHFSADVGWRLAFGLGAILSSVILFMRLWIPESPRWLVTHGRSPEADRVMDDLESRFLRDGHMLASGPFPSVRLAPRTHTPLIEVWDALVRTHRSQALVGLCLMGAQAFFYNAIFFTYALILTDFYGIAQDQVGWFILPFALGNVLGPIVLGRFFDTWGRRPMLVLTYGVSGLLLLVTAALFARDAVTASQLTVAWSCIFFFASAAASASYLTVAETFPLEIRALAIAVFYAIGTGIGGVIGPWLLARLIDSGSRWSVFAGYALGALLMLLAAVVAALWAVRAEGRSLESVARPLAARD